MSSHDRASSASERQRRPKEGALGSECPNDGGASESSRHHHEEAAARKRSVAIAVVTVSDTRDEQSDKSGAFLREAIAEAGHELAAYRLVRDEPDQVVAAVDALIEAGAEVVVVNGGTGISQRDTTYDALAPRLKKVIPGFGELFRMLSYEEIGPAAMLSRAIAGTWGSAVVFSTPGSSNAVKLAWDRLIAPEVAHLAWEMTR